MVSTAGLVLHRRRRMSRTRQDTIWCRRRDLNPHGFPHTPLKRARIPIPPRRHQYSLVKCLRIPSLSKNDIQSFTWIIDVHKVLNYISNFYSKNSTFHQPYSHRHWGLMPTACLHKIHSAECHVDISIKFSTKIILP